MGLNFKDIKTSIKNLLLFFISSFIIILLAEGYFTFKYKKSNEAHPQFFVKSSLFHHDLKTDYTKHQKNSEFNVVTHINSHGFRGNNIKLKKRAGSKRIFFLGDSFVFGEGNSDHETIPFLTQALFNKKQQDIDIINAGVPSYSTVLHFLKLKHKILKYQPDRVVLFFDMSDLHDDWLYEQSLLYDKNRNIIGCHPDYRYGKRDLWKWAKENSSFSKYLDRKLVDVLRKIKLLGPSRYFRNKKNGIRSRIAIMKDPSVEDPIYYDRLLLIRGDHRKKAILKHWQRSQKYLSMIHSLLINEEIPWMLVTYPYGVQVASNQWRQDRTRWAFEKNKVYNNPLAFNLLKKFAQKNKIPFVNLTNSLKKHAHERLYYDHNGHFTPRANEIIANTLVNHTIFKQ